ILSDVPWLSENPASDTVPPDSNKQVDVKFDATNLAVGDYNATLIVSTNDSGAAQFNIPVTLHVVALSCIFCDDFSSLDFNTTFGPWVQKPNGSYTAATGDAVGTTAKKADLTSPDFGG